MTIFRTFKLRRARAARERADKALQRAKQDRNTQAQNAAQRRLYEATHAAMRLEVRR